jgi:hypothetical protein
VGGACNLQMRLCSGRFVSRVGVSLTVCFHEIEIERLEYLVAGQGGSERWRTDIHFLADHKGRVRAMRETG